MRGAVSPYPNERREVTHDEEQAIIPATEFRYMLLDLRKAWADLGNVLEDRTHRVDEYQVQTLGSTLATQVALQPEYEVSEIIEAIIVTGPANEPASLQAATVPAGITNPAANATIVSISSVALQSIAPIGTPFNVQWTAELSGTIQGGDHDNMYLSSPLGTIRQQGEFPGAVGVYPQQGLTGFVPGSAGINVQANAAASNISAVYSASITATVDAVAEAPFTLKLGKRVWNLLLPTSGILCIAPVRFSLGRNDDRILTSSVPGDWSLELCGFANFTESYRSLA